ncbi:SusD/RagB family nutrient-binding outer membrane lipoprotein [Proteiniphilum sp.]|uniref:SusD/RagB family nutrient-binding outer membrane lipoprotein n=1 Tax=Proteiniphilum sp. TaxID=1926877 RepID=UPI002B21A135|nr:SusD/RagB family nutrient-binding outer membrane lipoprotein [Proteiniphilum sp.]MEA4919089.1 SusD/RagB family nutrient-binding outer membrane lipoprotein [Proteiniphilum sp.]
MKLLYILFILSAIGFISCIDEDLNIDPNRPSSVPTTSLISTAQKHLIDNVRGEEASLRSSALFVQQISQVTYTSQSRYDIPFGYSADIWSGLYSVLNNLQEIINLNTDPATKDLVTADGAGRNATQIAISRVLKSYAYYALTDIFGDVPYNSYGSNDPDFQALQQNPDNITPKYASQEKIYADILNELEQATDSLLKYSGEKTFGVSDIIYGGDNVKWAKFANSLRLRFATRLKAKNNALYQSHFSDALQKGVFTSNADNAVYKYAAAAPNEAPYYRATVTANRRDFALSKPFIDLLKGQNSQLPLADPRLSKYAAVNNLGVYEGLAYGLTEAQAGSFSSGDVSLPGTIYSAADFGEVLLEYSEVEFLISEYNNWNQANYVNGVRASLEKWGVATADINAYVSQLPSANQRNVLNQKYIALFTQFLEAWSDYRRTGYPDFLIKKDDVIFSGVIEGQSVSYTFSPLFGDGGIPARLYYPVKEQTVNLKNYQGAIAAQGNDLIQTKLWIFK